MLIQNNLSTLNKILGSALLTGFSKYFPGTLSSLLIVPLFWFIKSLSLGVFILIFIILIGYAFYSVPLFEKRYGKDPSCYTVDEVVATYLLLFIVGKYDFNYLTAFILWRCVDIFKPFYINRLQKISGALGVLLDDIAAVIITILLLYVLQKIF